MVANHHIAPGKKQWTWGNHAFGQAWDRNLTDEDGPYIELMSGVYTDNQPDFSFLHPGETRTFDNGKAELVALGDMTGGALHVRAWMALVEEREAYRGYRLLSDPPSGRGRLRTVARRNE